ncbi:MAG: hypothetical protein ACRC8G_12740 [Plesiomonas shigelloides]
MDEKTHQLLGELTATVKMSSEAVSRLSEDMRANSERQAVFEQGIIRANDDLRRISAEMVTRDRLRTAGLDLDEAAEHRKDFEHLRSARVAAEERKPISQGVIIAVLSAAALGLAGWAGAALVARWDTDSVNRQAAISNQIAETPHGPGGGN